MSIFKKKSFKYRVFLLFFIFCFIAPLSGNVSKQNSSTKDVGLQVLLPNDIKGLWKKDGESQNYKRDDLFIYINGGAEIYHEYGFEKIIVQNYSTTNGKSISLEIFEMTGPDAAYGIYTFKRSQDGKSIEAGRQGRLEGYYLNFWKGKYLITLTGFDEDKETINGLINIANAVDAKIDGKSEIPSLVKRLPEQGLIKPSIKYIKGNIGLFNSYAFFYENVFSVEECVRADYQSKYSVFIFSYKNDEDSQKIFNKAKKKFMTSTNYNNFSIVDDGSFIVTGNKKKLIHIRISQRFILVILGASFEKSLERRKQ